jgi:hypothetical protein
MKDSRLGECLWYEWTGEELDSSNLVFFTEDHVDLENEIVRRALASSLQRDGSADSLGEGFKLIEGSSFDHTYAGEIDGETYYTICDEDGQTRDGDFVDSVVKVTLVYL